MDCISGRHHVDLVPQVILKPPRKKVAKHLSLVPHTLGYMPSRSMDN